MVSTPSAAVQANEMEKKRKHTLERAKANHLSRQLQMRLQYARLKVEHGWQRQNLNEVENLYFHHSHQRGPKPTPSSLLAITQIDLSSSSSQPKFSDPSYRTWLHSLSQPMTVDVPLDGNSNQDNADAGNSTSKAPAPLSFKGSTTQQSTSDITSTAALADVQTSQLPSSLLPQSPTQSPLQNGNLLIESPALSGPASSSSSTLPNRVSLSPLPSYMSVPMSPSYASGNSPGTTFSATATTPVSASKSKKVSSRGQPSHKNGSPLTSKDMFSFGSSSLTYDSFWSGLQSKSYPAFKSSITNAGTETGTAAAGSGAGTTATVMAGTLTEGPSTGTSTAPALSPRPVPNPLLTSTPSPSLSFTHPFSSPTSATSTLVPVPPLSTLSSPSMVAQAPALLMNNAAQAQEQQFNGDMNPWVIGGASPNSATSLIPASLLANPAAFPFLASLSASYANALNTSGGQAHIPGMAVGMSMNDTGTTTTTTTPISPISTPAPVPVPAAITALVAEQES